ncbi:hypothetical protein BC628DRAFT_414760 [Trametes gibbosa]|nr:hypothetical protein BC628DRAFT_414760 [Trametes gibbosa]
MQINTHPPRRSSNKCRVAVQFPVYGCQTSSMPLCIRRWCRMTYIKVFKESLVEGTRDVRLILTGHHPLYSSNHHPRGSCALCLRTLYIPELDRRRHQDEAVGRLRTTTSPSPLSTCHRYPPTYPLRHLPSTTCRTPASTRCWHRNDQDGLRRGGLST